MKTKPKTAKAMKPHVKVQDIKPKKEVRGGFNPQPDPPPRPTVVDVRKPPPTAPRGLYSAQEALRDILSGELEYIGTGHWPGTSSPDGAFEEDCLSRRHHLVRPGLWRRAYVQESGCARPAHCEADRQACHFVGDRPCYGWNAPRQSVDPGVENNPR